MRALPHRQQRAEAAWARRGRSAPLCGPRTCGPPPAAPPRTPGPECASRAWRGATRGGGARAEDAARGQKRGWAALLLPGPAAHLSPCLASPLHPIPTITLPPPNSPRAPQPVQRGRHGQRHLQHPLLAAAVKAQHLVRPAQPAALRAAPAATGRLVTQGDTRGAPPKTLRRGRSLTRSALRDSQMGGHMGGP